jgi:tetratricopeptide (TPR) repeat protein
MNASLLFFYLALASSYLLMRPLATLVHALGHLLALRMGGMRGEIRVYLGSLGDAKRGWQFRIGRTIWLIHPRLLLMRGELLDYDQALGSNQLLLVAVAGPAASAALAAATCTVALVAWSAGPASLVLLLASVIAAMDAALSLLYRYDPIVLSNRQVTANDGQIIGWRWRYGRDLDRYLHARWLFEKDRYADAAAALTALIAAGHREKLLYEYLMYAQLMLHQPTAAITLYHELAGLHRLDAYDDCLYALALEQTEQPGAALAALEAAIAKAPAHHEALNHRAYRAMLRGDFAAAHTDLNLALRSNPEFAAALSNRAALLILGADFEKAKTDLIEALRQDHENPFTHRNWALLLLAQGDPSAAQASLESAKLLGLRLSDIADTSALTISPQ